MKKKAYWKNKKVIVKLNEREKEVEYTNVKIIDIIDGFLIVVHKPKPKIERAEPIPLNLINYWDIHD
jgi:hypothetical protein